MLCIKFSAGRQFRASKSPTSCSCKTLVASILIQAIMLKFKFIFQLAILMLIPSLTIGQNIQIKVFNKTGYDIDSVLFGHFYLGKLSKDSTVFLSGID